VYTENNTGFAFVGLPFHIVGSGDFNGDGRTDILWHNETTGETQIWLMDPQADGLTIQGRATVISRDGVVLWSDHHGSLCRIDVVRDSTTSGSPANAVESRRTEER
jgi:acetaldehyde dehydrogenase (acetylating)